MIKCIGREIDTALQRKNTYWYAIGIVALCIIANVAVVAFRGVYGANEGTYAYNIMEYGVWSFVVAYLSCIYISDIVFGKEYPKDEDYEGLSRIQIYIVKLVASAALALVFLVIAYVVFIAVTSIFQFKDGAVTSVSIRSFCDKLFLALPLFIAGIAFGNMFLFSIKNKKWAYAGFFIVTFAIPRAIILLSTEAGAKICLYIKPYLISQCFMLIPYPTNPDRNVALIISLGFIYAIISTIIGICLYSRCKESADDNKQSS